jgi:hypothetical protein
MQGKITICEFAKVGDNGSLYSAFNAGINRIHVGQFPAVLSMSVLIETRAAISEAGKEYPFEIKIIDEDGKPAGPPLAGGIKTGPDHKGAFYASINLQFMAKGPQKLTYALLINGEEKDSVNLEIKLGLPQQQVLPDNKPK